jgi:hypothetical protein
MKEKCACVIRRVVRARHQGFRAYRAVAVYGSTRRREERRGPSNALPQPRVGQGILSLLPALDAGYFGRQPNRRR